MRRRTSPLFSSGPRCRPRGQLREMGTGRERQGASSGGRRRSAQCWAARWTPRFCCGRGRAAQGLGSRRRAFALRSLSRRPLLHPLLSLPLALAAGRRARHHSASPGAQGGGGHWPILLLGPRRAVAAPAAAGQAARRRHSTAPRSVGAEKGHPSCEGPASTKAAAKGRGRRGGAGAGGGAGGGRGGGGGGGREGGSGGARGTWPVACRERWAGGAGGAGR